MPANGTVKLVDIIEQRIKDLNREMMRLPMAESRKRWKTYLSQLTDLMSKTTANSPQPERCRDAEKIVIGPVPAALPAAQVDARQIESPAESENHPAGLSQPLTNTRFAARG